MSPPRPLRPIATAVAGILAVLLTGELVVRTWIASPAATVPDARFGWRYLPHARLVSSREGYSVRHTNAQGLVDDETRAVRPRWRALLLGDSYAEALQVPSGAGFAEVAERVLPGLEVVNAGASGRSPVDHADWADLHAAALAPDVIVVQLTDGDFEDLMKPGVMERLARPPVAGEDATAPAEGRLAHLARVVMRRSALVTVSRQRIEMLVADQSARLSRRFREASSARAARPAGEAVDARIPALLDAVHARLTACAPRVVYVYIPHLVYTEPGCPARWPLERAAVQAFAERNHAPLLDVGDAFRAEFQRSGQPCHGFANSVIGTGHINSRGHRIVGEALARRLAEDLR
jgi:hypothetical protein